MTLYYNTVREKANNTLYPRCKTISSFDDLKEVVSHDHVCAQYKDNRRKKDNFIQIDCTMLDIDNTDSDDESKWITPADIAKAFKNVSFFIVYSRNHMKSKGGRKPRPKFHVYFQHEIISDLKEYENLKNNVCNYFPSFDDNAKDAARFFFGVESPQIEYFDGNITLTDFMGRRSICSAEEKLSISLYMLFYPLVVFSIRCIRLFKQFFLCYGILYHIAVLLTISVRCTLFARWSNSFKQTLR